MQKAFISVLGVSVVFLAAVLMDSFDILYKAFYPLMRARLYGIWTVWAKRDAA